MEILDVADYTIKDIFLDKWIDPSSPDENPSPFNVPRQPKGHFLQPLRSWIEELKIDSPQLARRICQLIPAQCPFARQIKLFGRTILTIPPLCKINPLYDELMMLRFRALSYLADECGEDISAYC